jgi:hypothetical protein
MRKGNEEKNERQTSLLQELCGTDTELYGCLSMHLYETPLRAISKTDLDALTAEAEDSGGLRLALDRAIFEGAQKPTEREKYVGIVRDLASKAVRAMEQERETALKEGLADLAASLGKAIERQQALGRRAEDILSVASKFYAEKTLERGEDDRRETRRKDRKEAEREDRKILKAEEAEREARRLARKGMTRSERREAKKQEKREALAAEERKEARRQQKQEAEDEDRRIGEMEREARKTRQEKRQGDAS